MVHQSMQWLVTAGDLKIGVLLGALLLLMALYLNQRRAGRDSDEEGENRQTPLEQLQVRYVNSEVNEEQYKHMRQELVHG